MPKFAKLTKLSRRTALLLGLVLVAVIAGIILLTHHKKTTSTIPSTNPTNNSSSTNTSNSSSSQSQPSQNNSSSSNNTPSGPPPAVPTGNFVSNHHPGGGAPTSEASTCNTTPGAVCYIEFTMGSEVKKLDAQTVSASGGTIWYWDVNTAGLSSGSWTITAVATLNGQTKTANDSLPLVVQ